VKAADCRSTYLTSSLGLPLLMARLGENPDFHFAGVIYAEGATKSTPPHQHRAAVQHHWSDQSARFGEGDVDPEKLCVVITVRGQVSTVPISMGGLPCLRGLAGISLSGR